jgi:rare lipoprotein A
MTHAQATPFSGNNHRTWLFIHLGIAGLIAAVLMSGCAPSIPRPRNPAYGTDFGPHEGMASFYGREFNGRKTASGERFDTHALTAAHRTLPFGTMVRVTNLSNGKSVNVRVNDRGPFKRQRIIDLSPAAAHAIGLDIAGTARVRIEVAK